MRKLGGNKIEVIESVFRIQILSESFNIKLLRSLSLYFLCIHRMYTVHLIITEI